MRLTTLQTVEKYILLNLDILNPNPTIARQLVSIRGERTAEKAIARMLPLLTAILRREQLILETTKILKGPKEEATFIRDLYAQLLEKIVVLSRSTRHDNKCWSPLRSNALPLTDSKLVELICRQVLDSLILLLPIAELLGALHGLLTSAEDDVGISTLYVMKQLTLGRFVYKF